MLGQEIISRYLKEKLEMPVAHGPTNDKRLSIATVKSSRIRALLN